MEEFQCCHLVWFWFSETVTNEPYCHRTLPTYIICFIKLTNMTYERNNNNVRRYRIEKKNRNLFVGAL